MGYFRSFRSGLAAFCSVVAIGFAAPAIAQDIELITKDPISGEDLTGMSHEVSISGDGRYTAFISNAVGGKTIVERLYVYDRQTDTTEEIVLKDESDVPLHTFLHSPYISGNGRFVTVFSGPIPSSTFSDSENLYVFDRDTGEQERIYEGLDGDYDRIKREVSISDDGNLVVFDSGYSVDPIVEGSRAGRDIYIFDRQSQTLEIAAKRNGNLAPEGSSFSPQITGDGQKILFYTEDTAMDGPNSQSGLFLRDLATETNLAIAYDGLMAEGHIQKILGGYTTTDGQYVAYMTENRNSDTDRVESHGVFLWSATTGTSELIFENPRQVGFGLDNPLGRISVSDDGNKILFGSTGYVDETDPKTLQPYTYIDERLYLFDRTTQTRRIVSSSDNAMYLEQIFLQIPHTSRGFQQQVSRDGNYLTFSELTRFSFDKEPNFNVFSGLTATHSAPPIANAGAIVLSSNGVAYPDGSASYDDVTASENLSYQWQLVGFPGIYDSITVENDKTANPTVTGGPPFVIKLTVKDEHGMVSEPDYVFVHADNYAPWANAGPDQAIIEGETVFLDGSESSDIERDELTFQWNLHIRPNGSQAVLDSTSVLTEFTPDVPGTYYAGLIANDGALDSRQDLVKITVQPNDLTLAANAVQAARQSIVELAETDLPWTTGRTRLLSFLDDALFHLGKERPLMARFYVNKALKRADGCALNGSADTKDWVKSCTAQDLVYPDLKSAWDILTE